MLTAKYHQDTNKSLSLEEADRECDVRLRQIEKWQEATQELGTLGQSTRMVEDVSGAWNPKNLAADTPK